MSASKQPDLSSKDGLLAYLSTIPTHLLLESLSQQDHGLVNPNVCRAHEQYLNDPAHPARVPGPNANAIIQDSTSSVDLTIKPLRPLNAFMGFRSWYSQILPEAQQKDISAFITKLWEKDVRRNEWSIIAKVYSSIRDIVGKNNISLKAYLAHACPIMKIVSPDQYLSTFKWSISINSSGDRILYQDETSALSAILAMSQEFPTTEIELLEAVLNNGFMPDHARVLIHKLGGNPKVLMTMNTSTKMQEFVQALINDPSGTATQVLGISMPIPVNILRVPAWAEVDESLILAPGDYTHYPADTNACVDELGGSEKGKGSVTDRTEQEVSGSHGSIGSETDNDALFCTSFEVSGDCRPMSFQQTAETDFNFEIMPDIYDPDFTFGDEGLDWITTFDNESLEQENFRGQIANTFESQTMLDEYY